MGSSFLDGDNTFKNEAKDKVVKQEDIQMKSPLYNFDDIQPDFDFGFGFDPRLEQIAYLATKIYCHKDIGAQAAVEVAMTIWNRTKSNLADDDATRIAEVEDNTKRLLENLAKEDK